MINLFSRLAVLALASASLACPLTGFANDAPTQARSFCRALASGDTEAMQKFYAETVTLIAGSEFLKPDWAIHENADRSRDLTLSRATLLKGYDTFFKKIGKERWREAMREITDDHLSFVTVQKDNEPFAGVKRDDVVLIVKPGAKADPLLFVFRRFESGEWLIVAELTDY